MTLSFKERRILPSRASFPGYIPQRRCHCRWRKWCQNDGPVDPLHFAPLVLTRFVRACLVLAPWLRMDHRLSHEGFGWKSYGETWENNRKNRVGNVKSLISPATNSSLIIHSLHNHHANCCTKAKVQTGELKHRPPCVQLRSRWSGATNKLSAGNKDTSMANYVSLASKAWFWKSEPISSCKVLSVFFFQILLPRESAYMTWTKVSDYFENNTLLICSPMISWVSFDHIVCSYQLRNVLCLAAMHSDSVHVCTLKHTISMA